MEVIKFKKGVYAELPNLLLTVKAGAIEKEMGVVSGWISLRINRVQNGKYSVRKFNETDIEKLNNGIWSLANKLIVTNIAYSEDRKICVKNVKDSLKYLFINSLAKEKLGWGQFDLSSRMLTGSSAKYRPQFTSGDIEQLVIGAREIATRMLSVEYVLDE